MVCACTELTIVVTSVLIVRESLDTTLLRRALHAGVRDVLPVRELAQLDEAIGRARALLGTVGEAALSLGESLGHY